MILDCKGIDHGIGSLDVVTEKFVEVVLPDTLSADGTPEAAQAATLERIFPDIHHSGGIGKPGTEPGNHTGQLGVSREQVGNDHHISGLAVEVFFRNCYRNGSS